jgi:hypothetical protein
VASLGGVAVENKRLVLGKERLEQNKSGPKAAGP